MGPPSSAGCSSERRREPATRRGRAGGPGSAGARAARWEAEGRSGPRIGESLLPGRAFPRARRHGVRPRRAAVHGPGMPPSGAVPAVPRPRPRTPGVGAPRRPRDGRVPRHGHPVQQAGGLGGAAGRAGRRPPVSRAGTPEKGGTRRKENAGITAAAGGLRPCERTGGASRIVRAGRIPPCAGASKICPVPGGAGRRVPAFPPEWAVRTAPGRTAGPAAYGPPGEYRAVNGRNGSGSWPRRGRREPPAGPSRDGPARHSGGCPDHKEKFTVHRLPDATAAAAAPAVPPKDRRTGRNCPGPPVRRGAGLSGEIRSAGRGSAGAPEYRRLFRDSAGNGARGTREPPERPVPVRRPTGLTARETGAAAATAAPCASAPTAVRPPPSPLTEHHGAGRRRTAAHGPRRGSVRLVTGRARLRYSDQSAPGSDPGTGSPNA